MSALIDQRETIILLSSRGGARLKWDQEYRSSIVILATFLLPKDQ